MFFVPLQTSPKWAFLTCLLFLSCFGSEMMAQKVTEPDFDRRKFPTYEEAKKARPKMVEQRAERAVTSAQSSLQAAIPCTGSFVPHDNTYTAVPRNDDGSLGPINLGWTFSFCGNNYNQVWINTNGNLTFNGPYGIFTPTGFPVAGVPMVAAFWSDIDTRNTACGQIWYKMYSNCLVVTWENTGYYNQHCDKTVSFNLIISDGSFAGCLGIGNTMGFRYGDMQFTTGDASGGSGGFGGAPATVGFNSGNGINFEQVGRFDHPGTGYDGPYNTPDGVDYLDNKCFDFKSNNPPSAVCKNATLGLGPSGTVALNPSAIDNGSFDDCGPVSLSTNPSTFGCSNIGTNVVVLTVTDNIGQTATCTAIVTVQDLVPITIACPPNITVNNMPNFCGAIVNYPPPIVNDNCPYILNGGPASGSYFPVGTTTVTYTATDFSNNTVSCTFTITVKDVQAPNIICPAPVTISCENPITPADVGSATATDNCAIFSITHTDQTVPGSCPNDYTVYRNWVAKDIHGNTSSCYHVIKVEDKKPPIIVCPPHITVACNTTVPNTGTATATDNCDLSVSISHQDFPISGDCDWLCVMERHWLAMDDCGNTSKCVQVITKDVTPLVNQALLAGPLVWGQTGATVTLPTTQGSCVVQWLPYTGTTPTALTFDDAVAGPPCTLMSNPLSAPVHIVNPLLGEAVKLKLLVRLNPALGTTKLSAIPCPMHFIVKQAMAPNPDVNELLRVTDLTLGNINANLLVPQHTLYLLDVLKCVNAGKSLCNP